MTARETYIAYLKLKVEEEDWHGAADACCDLRELDAMAKASGVRITEDRPGSVRFVAAGEMP